MVDTQPTAQVTLYTTTAVLLHEIDGVTLLMSFLGSLVFILHSEEVPVRRRLVYMVCAIAVGYYGAEDLLSLTNLTSKALASFIGAALFVSIVVRLIDAIQHSSKDGVIETIFKWIISILIKK